MTALVTLRHLDRRLLLIALVVLVAISEGAVAWTTAGTFDIAIWHTFMLTVGTAGPVRIYDLDFAGAMVYNHPALVGWWLEAVRGAQALGIPYWFTLRLPSILAHAATVFLVFELVARRRGERVAYLAAVAAALSPVLLIIAGFHGNNDPVVAAFMLLAVWLLVDRRAPVWAGFAFSLAVSVKITPMVILPVLLVAAWALGRRDLWRFVLGAVPVFALLWVPVLVLAGRGYLEHVLLYSGSGFPRQWGFYELLHLIHAPNWLLYRYAGKGTYLVLLACALGPAWLIRRRPADAPTGVGLALTAFVLLSPAYAPQYLAWIAGPVLLLALTPALIFTIGAGAAYLALYIWWQGDPTTLSAGQIPVLFVAWVSLIPVVVVTARDLIRPATSSPGGQPVAVPAPVPAAASTAAPTAADAPLAIIRRHDQR